jgi:hypothetical protein
MANFTCRLSLFISTMLIPAQSSKIISSSARKNVLKDHHLPCPSLGFGTVLATTDIEPSIDIFHARLRPLNVISLFCEAARAGHI